MAKTNFQNVEEYISTFDENVRRALEQLRLTIKKTAPKAEEVISYQMPAFKYCGMLVYFAAYKNHIGFYPTPSAIEAFKKELSAYEGAKGSVKFPIDKPLPLRLIAQIVRFKMKENLENEEAKAKIKKKSSESKYRN